MIFIETPLRGAWIVEPEQIEDERGFFARSYCEEAFAQRGLASRFLQCNISFNRKRGTLRGLHFQRAPFEETKLVRCTMGAVWDVIVDLRPDSQTCGQWHAEELSARNRLAMYIPVGFAHGFQTLTDEAEVFYQMSTAYQAGFEDGVHHAAPSLAIDWPVSERIVSARDAALPVWEPLA